VDRQQPAVERVPMTGLPSRRVTVFKRRSHSHSHSNSNSNSDSQQGGQSLLEFAIALPVLIILLLGVLDVGRMYFTFLAIQNAAGEGALYAAINPRCIQPSDGPECVNPNNALYRATHESPSGLVDWSRIEIEAELPSPLIEGAPIAIILHYKYDILTPLLSPLVPDGKLRLRARAVQNVIDLKQ